MSAPSLHLSGVVLPEGEHRDLWVRDGRVTFEPVPGAETVGRGGWLVPGLVDAHCHVGIGRGGVLVEDLAELREQALTERAAGVLALRDCGSPVDTRALDDEPDLPTIVRAGRHIARTRRYIRNYAHEVEPEQLVERVRLEARAGDGWVKLVGDWIDRDAGDLTPCWPADVLKEAVAAAHEEGARVTAHCFGEASLYDFAAAGTDCIEHATGLEPATIEQFAAQRIAIVPTLVNIATFPRIAEPAREKFPDYHRRMLSMHERRYETVAAAHEAGIAIHVGTDAGGSLPHGLVAQEAAELVKAGLTPAEALHAGIWGAREWLGRPGLDEGADADLVVYAADPRQDIGALAHPQQIVLRGRTVA